jgi:hypothetical protein
MNADVPLSRVWRALTTNKASKPPLTSAVFTRVAAEGRRET